MDLSTQMLCNDYNMQHPHADVDEWSSAGVAADGKWVDDEIEAAGLRAENEDTLPDGTRDESVSGGDEGVRAQWSDYGSADGQEGGCNSHSAHVNGSVYGSEY